MAAVRPVALLYVPAAQSVQLVALAAVTNFPAEHAVQLDAPAAEYLPAEHVSLHATLRPVEDEYVPASQAAHAAAPVPAEYVPAAHAAHPEEQTLKPDV